MSSEHSLALVLSSLPLYWLSGGKGHARFFLEESSGEGKSGADACSASCQFRLIFLRLDSIIGLTRRPSSLAGGFFVLLYYIPIYFQAVRSTSATNSGIRNLALIIADSMSPSSLRSLQDSHSPILSYSTNRHRLGHRYHAPRLLRPLHHPRRSLDNSRLRHDLHLQHDIVERCLDRLPSARRLRHRLLLPSSNHGRASAFPARRRLLHDRNTPMYVFPPLLLFHHSHPCYALTKTLILSRPNHRRRHIRLRRSISLQQSIHQLAAS